METFRTTTSTAPTYSPTGCVRWHNRTSTCWGTGEPSESDGENKRASSPTNPDEIIAEAVALVKAGGIVAFHEADHVAHVCDPPVAAWDRAIELNTYSYSAGIVFIGRKLPRLLPNAGVGEIEVRPLVHVYPPGHGRRTILLDFVENLSGRPVETARLFRTNARRSSVAPEAGITRHGIESRRTNRETESDPVATVAAGSERFARRCLAQIWPRRPTTPRRVVGALTGLHGEQRRWWVVTFAGTTVNPDKGERMAAFPPITHVALTVRDLSVSVPWYEALLGVEPVLDEDTDPEFHHTVYLIGDGQLFGLHQHVTPAPDEQFSEFRLGLDHVAFGCANRQELEEWVRRLDELGIAHGGIKDATYGLGLSFRDPDGIALEFFAPPD
jgi:glyoxylase I family protein